VNVYRLGGLEGAFLQHYDPFRIWIWQWLEQNPIHEAENGRVCTNADGEREDRDRREPGRFAKRPDRVLDSAHFPKRLVAGVFSRHAIGDVVINKMFQMKPKFLVKLALYATPSQQRSHV
jgi:hypothetical protein